MIKIATSSLTSDAKRRHRRIKMVEREEEDSCNRESILLYLSRRSQHQKREEHDRENFGHGCLLWFHETHGDELQDSLIFYFKRLKAGMEWVLRSYGSPIQLLFQPKSPLRCIQE